MKKLFEQLKRIFMSTKNLVGKGVEKTTKGAGVVVSSIGAAGAAIITIVGMAVFLVVLMFASIPYGVFGGIKDKEKVTEGEIQVKAVEGEPSVATA